MSTAIASTLALASGRLKMLVTIVKIVSYTFSFLKNILNGRNSERHYRNT